MADHTTHRGDAVHVALTAGMTDADWAVLYADLPCALRPGTVVTVDASDLTLVPEEVARIDRLATVATTAGAEVEVACSRLSGRAVLRRLLPRDVAVVLPWSHRAPLPLGSDRTDPTGVDPAAAGPASPSASTVVSA